MIGVPRALLDELAHGLAVGPIGLDLLQTLLAGEFAATPMALLLADELVARCELPCTPDPREQALWRDLLVHALRLPVLQWEMVASTVRGGLSTAATA